MFLSNPGGKWHLQDDNLAHDFKIYIKIYSYRLFIKLPFSTIKLKLTLLKPTEDLIRLTRVLTIR